MVSLLDAGNDSEKADEEEPAEELRERLWQMDRTTLARLIELAEKEGTRRLNESSHRSVTFPQGKKSIDSPSPAIERTAAKPKEPPREKADQSFRRVAKCLQINDLDAEGLIGSIGGSFAGCRGAQSPAVSVPIDCRAALGRVTQPCSGVDGRR